MDELQKHYQQIRGVLSNLASAVDDAPVSVAMGHELGRSRAYLHSHCAECGCAIAATDYTQVFEQECARVGAAGMAGIEAQPICPACYTRLRRALSAFAPGRLRAQQISAAVRRLEALAEITVSTGCASSPTRAVQLRHRLRRRLQQPRHGAVPLRRP